MRDIVPAEQARGSSMQCRAKKGGCIIVRLSSVCMSYASGYAIAADTGYIALHYLLLFVAEIRGSG